MASNSEFRSLFTQLVQKPDKDIYLDLAALYLAGEEYPGLDVSSNLAHLDALATQVSARVTYEAGPPAIAGASSGFKDGIEVPGRNALVAQLMGADFPHQDTFTFTFHSRTWFSHELA